jgi:mono/diheme cytochrome c family protein
LSPRAFLSIVLLIACHPPPMPPKRDSASSAAPTTDTLSGLVGDRAADSITPKMVALGDSVFHGRVGNGLCFTCHGPEARGSALAPDLTAGKWLNTDGSYSGIVTLIRSGVPTPKSHPNPMPPSGGGNLSELALRAVAAYVYQVSRRKQNH